jgi:DNA-binding response OmpR family regulator
MTGFAGTDTWGTDMVDVEILSKPFSIDEFTAAVSKTLDASRQEARASQGSKR